MIIVVLFDKYKFITCLEINEIMGFAKYRELLTKFQIIPIDYNGFWSSFTPKNRHVDDVGQTRGGSVYYLISIAYEIIVEDIKR